MNQQLIILLILVSFSVEQDSQLKLQGLCRDKCFENQCKSMTEKRESDCLNQINDFLYYLEKKEQFSNCMIDEYEFIDFYDCAKNRYKSNSYNDKDINNDSKPTLICISRCAYQYLNPHFISFSDEINLSSSPPLIAFGIISLLLLMI